MSYHSVREYDSKTQFTIISRNFIRSYRLSSAVGCLPRMYGALGLIPSTKQVQRNTNLKAKCRN